MKVSQEHGQGYGGPDHIRMVESSTGPVRSVFEALDTVPEGLTESEVQERLETHGRNTVAHERATAWPRMLLNNFRNPFILVLFVLGSVSYATGDLKGTAVVSVMVVVSGMCAVHAVRRGDGIAGPAHHATSYQRRFIRHRWPVEPVPRP